MHLSPTSKLGYLSFKQVIIVTYLRYILREIGPWECSSATQNDTQSQDHTILLSINIKHLIYERIFS